MHVLLITPNILFALAEIISIWGSRYLVDSTLAALIVCGTLQFLVSHSSLKLIEVAFFELTFDQVLVFD